MPRSAAKSQAEKQRPKSSVPVNQPPTPDLKVEDIIPGRLTQAQWTDMLIREDADEAVAVIIEDVLSKVMERCLKLKIKRQVKLKRHIQLFIFISLQCEHNLTD